MIGFPFVENLNRLRSSIETPLYEPTCYRYRLVRAQDDDDGSRHWNAPFLHVGTRLAISQIFKRGDKRKLSFSGIVISRSVVL